MAGASRRTSAQVASSCPSRLPQTHSRDQNVQEKGNRKASSHADRCWTTILGLSVQGASQT
eukprot:2519464-Amphidinium_carterae.1